MAHRPDIPCHPATEHIVGVGLEAQQLCQFTTQVDQSFADFEVILRIVMNTLRILRHIHLATEFALCRVSHERRIAGEVECKHPPFLALLLRFVGSRLASGLWQSVQLGLIRNVQGKCLVLLQHVLRELQSQHSSLFCELTQSFLASGIQQSATPHKPVVAVVQQHLLLRRQCAVMMIHILDTFEEPFVQSDIIGMLGEYRTQFLCQGIHLVVGVSTQQIEEYTRHLRQQVIISLVVLIVVHTNDGVLKRRCRWVVDDHLYLLILTTDTLHESLLVVFQPYLVEGWNLMGCMIVLEKGIHSLYLLFH